MLAHYESWSPDFDQHDLVCATWSILWGCLAFDGFGGLLFFLSTEVILLLAIKYYRMDNDGMKCIKVYGMSFVFSSSLAFFSAVIITLCLRLKTPLSRTLEIKQYMFVIVHKRRKSKEGMGTGAKKWMREYHVFLLGTVFFKTWEFTTWSCPHCWYSE